MQRLETFLKRLTHHIQFAPHQAQVGILLAYETQDEAEDGFGDVDGFIVLDDERLQLIVVEGFVAELDILVADVCKHCCL